MTYFIDIGFKEAIKNNNSDRVQEYLNEFSKNNLKYQDVKLEHSLNSIETSKFNASIWGMFFYAHSSFSKESFNLIFDYIIENYKNEPQENVGIPEMIDGFLLSNRDDLCHKIIDNGFISPKDYKYLMDKSYNLSACNKGNVIDKIYIMCSEYINKHDDAGCSYLGRAISSNNFDNVKLLLNNGAKTDVPVSLSIDEEVRYPLEFAKSCDNDDIYQYIKKHKMIEISKEFKQENIINQMNVNKIKAKKIPKILGFNKK